MRVVLDTNTLVSGIISPGGPPRILLDGARTQVFELCSSATLLAELLDVLAREKFAARLAQAGVTPQNIVADLRRLAHMAAPQDVPRVIEQDADDDHRAAWGEHGLPGLRPPTVQVMRVRHDFLAWPTTHFRSNTSIK